MPRNNICLRVVKKEIITKKKKKKKKKKNCVREGSQEMGYSLGSVGAGVKA